MKKTLISASIALAATSAIAENSDMIAACQQTGYDYAWYLDHPDADLSITARKFATLFTEEATWKVSNTDLEIVSHVGTDAIQARYLQGRDQFRFMHLIANHRVVPTSETTATGTSYVEFYIHPIGADMTHEFGITGVAEYRDVYEFKDGICRITLREGVPRLISLQNKITDPIPE